MQCTVKQLAEKNPGFTEASIRWLLFHRETNGLKVAVIKIGKKLLIDSDKFEEWVKSHQGA